MSYVLFLISDTAAGSQPSFSFPLFWGLLTALCGYTFDSYLKEQFQAMKTNHIKFTIIMLLCGALLPKQLQATIEKVKLQVGSGGPQNVSRELFVANSNSNVAADLGLCWERVPVSLGVRGGRMPFRINSSHLVTLTGDWLNTCDRVEILNASGSIVQTLRDAALTKTTVNGKGQLKFTVPSTRLTGVGNFELRVRYLVETNGFDVLRCRVVKVGVINFVKWVGPNIPTQTSISGGERSTLIRDLEYKLEFTNGNTNGTDFGTAVSLACVPLQSSSLNITAVTVNSTGNTITVTMKPGGTPASFFTQAQTITPNLQDFSNGNNFEFIGISGQDRFATSLPNIFGGHVMHSFSTALSTVGDFTNLKEIVLAPPPPAPDIVPLTPTSFGTTYNFGSLTVTDQNGKIYKNIEIPATQDLNDLGTQLSSTFLISNTSRCVSRQIGTDPTLGTVTLHEIAMGTYTCPITNYGSANATTTFTNTFRGNMVAATAQTLPQNTPLSLVPRTTFPVVTTVTQTLPSLNQGIINNSIVHKRNIQVFTFSNRPGSFYCDSAWPSEQGATKSTLITITVDSNNNINESLDGGESNNVYPK